MIVVEQVLADAFKMLPAMGVSERYPEGFKPVYHFGDGIELNKFIIGNKHAVYPLIYQTSFEETQYDKKGYVATNLELVLAMQNTETDMFNSQRWATSYKNILMPLFENINTLFKQSGIIRSDYEWRVRKRPNYSQTEIKDKNVTVDIIDAIVVNLTIEITKGCLPETIIY